MNLFWQISSMCLLLKTVKSTFKSEELKSILNGPNSMISFEQVRLLEELLTTKFHSKFKKMENEHRRHLQTITKVEETLLQQQKEINRLKHVERTLKKEQKKTARLIESVEQLSYLCNLYQTDRSISQSDIFNNKTRQQFDSDAVSRHSNPGNLSKERDKLNNKFPTEAEENEMMVNNQKREDNDNTAKSILGAPASTTESTVGFYAYMTHNENNIGPHHSLIFDHVETNVGSSYNRYTGAFSVPIAGVYLFTYSIFMEIGGYDSFEISINDVSRGSIFVDNNRATQNAYTGSTGVAILVLNQGDACVIRTHSNYPHGKGTVRSDDLMRTSFSGASIGSA